MDKAFCDELIRQEKSNGWHMARRALLRHILGGISLPPEPLILDAGCGSGGNLPILAKFGTVLGFEPEEKLREAAQSRGIGTIESGSLPYNTPFEDKTFDLIALLDVLGHLEDDSNALKALHEKLNKRGLLIITVSAHPWIFNGLDRRHGNLRRYSRAQLKKLLNESGYQIEFFNLWNISGLFALCALKLAEKLGAKELYKLFSKPFSKTTNRVIGQIIAAERHLLPHIHMPCGASFLVIARKIS